VGAQKTTGTLTIGDPVTKIPDISPRVGTWERENATLTRAERVRWPTAWAAAALFAAQILCAVLAAAAAAASSLAASFSVLGSGRRRACCWELSAAFAAALTRAARALLSRASSKELCRAARRVRRALRRAAADRGRAVSSH